MLRTLGSLTLVWCIACSVVSAADVGRATRDPGERTRRVSKPVADAGAARMVTVEVLIADVRRGDAAKSDADDPHGDPKARIQQLEKAGKLDSLTRVQPTNGVRLTFCTLLCKVQNVSLIVPRSLEEEDNSHEVS